jgi:hypothetical protein
VWYALWFLVILKIPVLYLMWVIWWAVKDPPDGQTGELAEGGGEDGGLGHPPDGRRRPSNRSHRGPDRRPAPRPVRPRTARSGDVG